MAHIRIIVEDGTEATGEVEDGITADECLVELSEALAEPDPGVVELEWGLERELLN